jgi:RNA polymerase sigma-70 factor (ECF subfamily)
VDAPVQVLPETVVSPDAAREREFEERLRDSSGLAFRVALGVLRNPADAEDVAQEAFVRAYRNFDRLRDPESFRAWLVRIVWRLALDRMRADRRRERREQAFLRATDPPEVEDGAAAREFERRLAEAIGALPEKLRLVLLLGAVQGHDLAEVARLLGVPEGTVKSRMHLARRRLAEALR